MSEAPIAAEASKEPGAEGAAKAAREPFPFYPILAFAFPVLALYSANASIVPAADLARPLGIALALGAVLLLAGSLPWRSFKHGAASALVGVVLFWLYAPASDALTGKISGFDLNLIFIAVLLAGGWAAGRWAPSPKPLNIIAGFLIATSLGHIVWINASPIKATAASKSVAAPLPPGPRPDVFHIVLDGFGREDVLRSTIGVDLGWFTSELRKRGFQVAERARANYVQTELSVTSALNMDFLPAIASEEVLKGNNRRSIRPLMDRPLAARRLEASGYQYIAIGTRFEGLNLGPSQMRMPAHTSITLFEGMLLTRAPWSPTIEYAGGQFDAVRRRILNIFERLGQMGRPTSSPRHVFVHILSPHPPFVFGPNGEPRRPKGPFGYWDASDYMTSAGTPETYRLGYADQVTFIARKTLALIDELKAKNPSNPPVIIIQGDHGSKSGLDQNSLDRTNISEAFSILYAVHAPAAVPLKVSSTASPVNTYRRLLSALGAEDLPLRPDRSWYSTYPEPFTFTEVTSQIP